jgi:hypothetical protein
MDGRLRIAAPNQVTEYRYQFVNDSTISIIGVSSSGGNLSGAFSINGNKLNLDLSGQEMNLTRVP